MKKELYYKCVNIRQDFKHNRSAANSKLAAYGIKHEFIKDGKKFTAFYDSKNKMFTEAYSGKLINTRAQANQKEAIAQVYYLFDVIYNQLQNYIKKREAVADLPEVFDAVGV